MNQLSVAEGRQHTMIIGWLMILGHIIFLAVGVFLFFLLSGIGAVSGDAQAMTILTIVGTALALLLTVLGLPGVAAGYGLLKRQSWGRALAIVVAVFNLLNFPVGTLVGVYTLWVMLQQSANDYFAGTQASYT